MSKRGRGRRDIIEELESQGRRFEAFFLGWSIVEFFASSAVYGVRRRLTGKVPDWDKLHEHVGITAKLKELRRGGYVSQSEFDTLEKFRDKRDELAHDGALFSPNYTDEHWSELIDLACAGADAIYAISDRALQAIPPSGAP